MHTPYWHLQDAKARFSQVVEAALQGEPQHVTRRGKEAVVVLSEAAYRALHERACASAPSLVTYLMAAPRQDEPAQQPAGPTLREIEF